MNFDLMILIQTTVWAAKISRRRGSWARRQLFEFSIQATVWQGLILAGRVIFIQTTVRVPNGRGNRVGLN